MKRYLIACYYVFIITFIFIPLFVDADSSTTSYSLSDYEYSTLTSGWYYATTTDTIGCSGGNEKSFSIRKSGVPEAAVCVDYYDYDADVVCKTGWDVFGIKATLTKTVTDGEGNETTTTKEVIAEGCRKIKDVNNLPADLGAENVELNVGDFKSFDLYSDNECDVLKGSDILEDKSGCSFNIKKAGTAIVRYQKNRQGGTLPVTNYYIITVEDRITSVSQLDSNYEYASVTRCVGSRGLAGESDFDGITICGSSAAGYEWNDTDVTCTPGYEAYKISVKGSDGVNRRGFICRKPKNIEYTQIELPLGFNYELDKYNYYKCQILEGDSVSIVGYGCLVKAEKHGTTKLMKYDSDEVEYYEFTVPKAPTKVSELDDDYYYGDVSKCHIGSGAYNFGILAGFDGLVVCEIGALAESYNSDGVECYLQGYEPFEFFWEFDGRNHHGYICRIPKDEVNIDDLNCEQLEQFCQAGDTEACTKFEEKYYSQCDSCMSLLGDPKDSVNKPPAYFLALVFDIMKYAGIVLLIVLTILDFIGAISSHDESMLNKAMNKAIRRAILCVVIFLIPTLLEFVLSYMNNQAISTCGIK